MADPIPDESTSSRSPDTSLAGCLLSVFRNLVGPGLLFVVGASILVNRPRLGSAWDFIFLAVLLATLGAALWAPQKPATTPLQPGDAAPMSRSMYAALILAASVAIFVFAHFIAPKVF